MKTIIVLLQFAIFFMMFQVIETKISFHKDYIIQNDENCRALIAYFARIGKPLSKDSISVLDQTMCNRFEGMIKTLGLKVVDKRLADLLAFRKKQMLYKECMKKYMFYRFCHRQVYNSLYASARA